MKHHPAADMFPITESLIQDLTENMQKRGFDPQHPIVRCNGAIVDGRHRHAAALLARVQPQFTELPEDVDPYQFAWSANTLRYELPSFQRAGIFVKMNLNSEDWQKKFAEARDRQSGGQGGVLLRKTSSEATRRPRHEMAEAAGSNEQAIQMSLTAASLKEEDPELLQDIVKGRAGPAETARRIRQAKGQPPKAEAEKPFRHQGPTEKTQQLVEKIKQTDEDFPYAPDDAKAHKLGIHPKQYANLRREYVVGRKVTCADPLQKLAETLEDLAATFTNYSVQYERLQDQSSEETKAIFKNSVKTLFSNVKKLKDQIQ